MNDPNQIDERSATALAFLARVPRFVFILVIVGWTIGGLALRGIPGSLFIFALAAFVGWLAWLTWPERSGPPRVLRLVVVAMLVAGAVLKLL